MYQHHIQLRTHEPIDKEQALAWYQTVRDYGPDDVVFTYVYNDDEVTMEYGTCEDCESPHVYTVPLNRDLTTDEALFIVNVWEHIFPDDFDIEMSNNYSTMDDDVELSIDDEVREAAIRDLNKWNHNRWVSEMISEGWRQGSYYNSKEKTHPALRDWDSLPESHRRSRQIEDKEIFEWLKRNKII
jgi:hypothetical protein